MKNYLNEFEATAKLSPFNRAHATRHSRMPRSDALFSVLNEDEQRKLARMIRAEIDAENLKLWEPLL